MKIALIYNTSDYLYRFRRELIEMLQQRGHDVIAIAPKDEATEKLQALGVKWFDLPISSHGVNLFTELRTTYYLYRILRQERPQIVFNFTIKPVIYGSMAAATAGVKKVYSMITGAGYVFLEGGWFRIILRNIILPQYRVAMRLNKKVFFQNPDDKAVFLKNGLIKPKQAVLINGSGVNLNKFLNTKTNPMRKGVFLLIARLLYEKGIHDYVEAARIIKQQYPEVEFWLIGPFDTNPAAISQHKVDSWRQEACINYLGAKSDVRPYLEQAMVYVLPSYREGTPRSVLEALAMGKPVITTDVVGCRETVIDGKNGFLVPVKNPTALASAMEKLLVNPDLVEKMGQASRKLAVEKYDVFKVNQVILDNILETT